METIINKKEQVKAELDKVMSALNCNSYEALATKIGASKDSILKWIQRGKIPEKWILKFGQLSSKNQPLSTNQHAIEAEVLTIRPGAGPSGTEIEAVDLFGTGEKIIIDRSLFKTPPKGRLRAMQVDGYSMVPMLFPDSWVVIDETHEFVGDGLYVLNFDNVLMVKLLEINMSTGNLFVKSVNPQYDSWEIKKDDQRKFEIYGKVLRCII